MLATLNTNEIGPGVYDIILRVPSVENGITIESRYLIARWQYLVNRCGLNPQVA